jgi:peptidoglycan biosynthesis protein MviN/MurJ (putative lipid II flippase)
MAIIGVSYSLAAFPTLARFFHEKRMEDFMASVVTSARHIIFWSLPIIFLFIVLRAQIVRTILGSGEFTWSDTRLTAAALALFIISALAQSLILLFVRAYYAAGQTRKPLFINTISSIFVIALSFVLVNFYQSSENMREFFEVLLRVDGGLPSSVLMLPLAFSIGTIFNVLLLWISFEKSFAKFTYILIKPFFQSIFASFIAGYVSYLFLNFFSNIFNLNKLSGIFSQGLFSGILGIIAGIIVLILFDNYELQEVWKTLHHKIWGAKAITSGQGEL